MSRAVVGAVLVLSLALRRTQNEGWEVARKVESFGEGRGSQGELILRGTGPIVFVCALFFGELVACGSLELLAHVVHSLVVVGGFRFFLRGVLL